MAKAQLKLDPRLIQTMGRQLYSGDSIFIIPRELYQNSMDAIHQKFGNDAGGKLNILIDLRKLEIMFEDNGVGMSETDLTDFFLTLGASGKIGQNSAIVGRFGIAKAAILSCPEWRVETNEWWLDQKVLAAQEDIPRLKNPRVGTKVWVKLEDRYVGDWTRQKPLLAILMSDNTNVDVNVELITPSKYEESRSYLFNSADFSVGLTRVGGSMGVTQYQSDPFSLMGTQVEGCDIIRVHGQVQILSRSSDIRKSNLVFDLAPTVPPDDPKYPLTMSREEIKKESPAGLVVLMAITAANTDLITAEDAAREVQERERIAKESGNTVSVIEGNLIQGKNSADIEIRTKTRRDNFVEFDGGEDLNIQAIPTEIEYDESTGKITLTGSDGEVFSFDPRMSPSNQSSFYGRIDGKFYTLKLDDQLDAFLSHLKSKRRSGTQIVKHYYKRPDSETRKWHAKLLKAWQEVCTIVMTDSFGIGITTVSSTKAARLIHEGIVYYIMNPNLYSRSESTLAIVQRLYHRACHEGAHSVRDIHDELFANAEGVLADSSAEEFVKEQFRIAKILG